MAAHGAGEEVLNVGGPNRELHNLSSSFLFSCKCCMERQIEREEVSPGTTL